MSQKKVDEYKKFKKNRRKNIKKEVFRERLGKATVILILCAIVVGCGIAGGVSAYNTRQKKLASLPSFDTTQFVLSDYAGIQNTEENTAGEAESEAETDRETSEETGSDSGTGESVPESAEEATAQG